MACNEYAQTNYYSSIRHEGEPEFIRNPSKDLIDDLKDQLSPFIPDIHNNIIPHQSETFFLYDNTVISPQKFKLKNAHDQSFIFYLFKHPEKKEEEEEMWMFAWKGEMITLKTWQYICRDMVREYKAYH